MTAHRLAGAVWVDPYAVEIAVPGRGNALESPRPDPCLQRHEPMPAHMSSEIDDAMTSRQSVRRFTDEPVDEFTRFVGFE